jgi:penicillin-binding protein 1A
VGYSEPRSLGERESGGGLALPIWIDYMATALKGVPEVPLQPPPGVLKIDQDWVYEEWALGGWLERLPAEPDRLRSGSRAASAASAPLLPPVSTSASPPRP